MRVSTVDNLEGPGHLLRLRATRSDTAAVSTVVGLASSALAGRRAIDAHSRLLLVGSSTVDVTDVMPVLAVTSEVCRWWRPPIMPCWRAWVGQAGDPPSSKVLILRVLLYGVNSTNKGAQLLLAAASQRLAAAGHRVVVNARDVDRGTRDELGLVGLVAMDRLGKFRSGGLNLLPPWSTSGLRYAPDDHYDYVLDASGYSLTDSWGMAPVVARLRRISRWTRRGVGMGLLPQALGPFNRPDVASGARQVLSAAEFVYARDERSADYAHAILPGLQVSRVPDITVTLHVEPRRDLANAVVLVPNWNLAARGGTDGRARYIRSLVEQVRGLRDRRRHVVGLCHEGPRDAEILRAVSEQVGGLQVVSPNSGLEAKGFIAGADLVIAGRYHALVSSFSAGVPAIGHSWSHKYAALMADYQVDRGLADPYESEDTLALVDALDPTATRAGLKAAQADLEKGQDLLWRDVLERLDQHQWRR
ncbi:polysaccharide pyruvyl transferase family protein [Geodermatophilus sp. SYSU D00965]